MDNEDLLFSVFQDDLITRPERKQEPEREQISEPDNLTRAYSCLGNYTTRDIVYFSLNDNNTLLYPDAPFSKSNLEGLYYRLGQKVLFYISTKKEFCALTTRKGASGLIKAYKSGAEIIAVYPEQIQRLIYHASNSYLIDKAKQISENTKLSGITDIIDERQALMFCDIKGQPTPDLSNTNNDSDTMLFIGVQKADNDKPARTQDKTNAGYFLYEFDNISLKEQKRLLIQLTTISHIKDSVYSAIYSGNKSIHILIKTNEDATNYYKEFWKVIFDTHIKVYLPEDLQDTSPDEQAGTHNHLTRRPNIVRKDNTREQTLYYFNPDAVEINLKDYIEQVGKILAEREIKSEELEQVRKAKQAKYINYSGTTQGGSFLNFLTKTEQKTHNPNLSNFLRCYQGADIGGGGACYDAYKYLFSLKDKLNDFSDTRQIIGQFLDNARNYHASNISKQNNYYFKQLGI